MLCSILSLRAQTFVKPAVKVKDTSFAVITDKGTFQACEAELKAYQEILGMEGLPTFIVYNEWNKPEEGLLIPDHDHLALLFHRLIPSKLALGLRPSLFRGMPTGKWIIRPYIATDLGGDY